MTVTEWCQSLADSVAKLAPDVRTVSITPPRAYTVGSWWIDRVQTSDYLRDGCTVQAFCFLIVSQDVGTGVGRGYELVSWDSPYLVALANTPSTMVTGAEILGIETPTGAVHLAVHVRVEAVL